MLTKRIMVQGALAAAAAAVCPVYPSYAGVDGLSALLRVGQDLDERNISGEGRLIVIPAWMGRSIRRELSFIPPISTEHPVMIDRFRVYQNDNKHPDYVEVGHNGCRSPWVLRREHINVAALLRRS